MRATRTRSARSLRTLLLGAVVAVLALAGSVVWLTRRSSAPTSFRLRPASFGTVRQTIATTGTIEPGTEAELDFATGGRVAAVDVSVGETVSAGQTIASVDTTTLAAQVAQAQAALAADQAKLAGDQSSGTSSAQIAADQASVTAGQAQLADAQQSLSEANLATPISGVVAAVNLSDGQQVGGGGASGAGSGSVAGSSAVSGVAASAATAGSGAQSGSSQPSPEVLVVNTGSFTVSTSVSDTDIGQMKVGEQAIVVPDGSTTPVYGTVTSVGLLASATSGVPTFPVTISVTGRPAGLFVGAGAEVSIVVRQVSGVLTVPTAAVHTSGTRSFVYELRAGKEVARVVGLGLSSGPLTQVTSGLTAGQQVVMPVVKLAAAGRARGGVLGRGGGFGGGGAQRGAGSPAGRGGGGG